MLPGSHAGACSTSRFCHAGDADLDSIHQYLPALMQPNQHNDCSAHLTNSFSRDIMESVNGSCNSLISSSSDWSTSSFMALNTLWFYEQREFPPMQRPLDHDVGHKPLFVRGRRKIKASFKGLAGRHVENCKSAFLNKLRSFLPSRVSKKS
ncbi:uncharacterized protein BKA78DRAFT_357903 [Phyllosticta capitalensis]|uniref:Uncharacterized protein n=1 Tax=Phyllosticta capitalensis TaxID=121624 RepID=A0ABR1Y9D1_9PEZI